MKERKYSRKRDAILHKLQTADRHPTADWIFQELKTELPDLSLDTVYRNLRLFKQDGVIESIGVVNGQEHFEVCTEHEHGHFICDKCHSVEDISINTDLKGYLDNISSLKQAKVDRVELIVRGICRDCLITTNEN